MLNELTRNDVGPETVPTTGIGLGPISPYSSDFLSEPATASAVPPSSVPSTRAAMDQRRRPKSENGLPDDGGEARHDGDPPRVESVAQAVCLD